MQKRWRIAAALALLGAALWLGFNVLVFWLTRD